ncbi:hypothetical protein ACFQ6E_33895 [Streptomyces sp. NPDC056462]|uniref:hypothetical protein n=1 Tax=Streptomyces sp. NPDC056462 TaxID=3345826 RepID=UPI00367445FC
MPRASARADDHRLPRSSPRTFQGGVATTWRRRTLADLQARQDEAAAAPGASELRDQMQHLNATQAETEARLTELVTTGRPLWDSPRQGSNPNRPS